MRRNNSSGTANPSSCTGPAPAIPWNDRQVVFFEGTEDTVANIAQLASSFPSTNLPGSAGYNTVTDMNVVFSKGFINAGADNVFNNNSGTGTGYNSNANNIERMDLFVSGGVNVTTANRTKTGIVIVCRGPADDPVVLSAIKALTGGTNTGGGTSYIYDDVIKINATWTSKTINGVGPVAITPAQKTTLITGINSVILRRIDSDGSLNDQLPAAQYPTVSSYVSNQNIVGMFFTFADLGLAAGETFYGYSLGGYDVTATNSTQFNSYLNSAIFPLNTDPANGGIDLTGFPGLFSPMDIDDDDDGLPDYLEANLALTFGDADANGTLNYCDATYPGFIDNNGDGINDNFDPSADSDNDGIPNYRDNSFVLWGFTDLNGDGVNDIFDWDLDGVPNHLDRDSDNDGIPDVAESFGVDANGDGIIDNYTDTDVDGLSQNVDGNNTGAVSSGAGLGAIDTDGDGIPNYLDLDSDNDGIPDVVEAYGVDANNNANIDSYTDTDGDGYSDNVDGDVGNDNFAENSSASLLRTGADANSDGRADSWPYKNMDADTKPNPYDLDSDGDGIADVREAQFADADLDGRVDGSVNAKGWNTGIAAMGSLSIPNSDATGHVNVYDIDSDNDGIPDNVEGMATLAYMLPSGSDTDGDGIDNTYDTIVGFGGKGITPYDLDGDTIPDYLDSDTDSDGLIDRIEGNDFNFNGLRDDNVTLTGTDTDDDGLDDRFDNNNSSAEATSAYMGNGGTTSGDITPGSITTVQHTAIAGSLGCPTERDWRCIWYVLSCDIINFKAALQNQQVILDWKAICRQEVDHFVVERSTDRINFTDVLVVTGRRIINETESYQGIDNITGITADIIYYRLRTVAVNGKISLNNIIAIRRNDTPGIIVQILPNPARTQLQLQVKTEKASVADVYIIDVNGRTLYTFKENLVRGNNTLSYNQVQHMPSGSYYLRLNAGDIVITKKFNVVK
ncbi:MAG TPA: T9SS type A sorting domain-containing protein [Chitinophagaceae bacterium]